MWNCGALRGFDARNIANLSRFGCLIVKNEMCRQDGIDFKGSRLLFENAWHVRELKDSSRNHVIVKCVALWKNIKGGGRVDALVIVEFGKVCRVLESTTD